MATESGRAIWYRGLIIPLETQTFTVAAPLTMLEEAAVWDIHVGAGYGRVPEHIKGRVGQGSLRVPNLVNIRTHN